MEIGSKINYFASICVEGIINFATPSSQEMRRRCNVTPDCGLLAGITRENCHIIGNQRSIVFQLILQ